MRKLFIIILLLPLLLFGQGGINVDNTTTPYSYTLDGDLSYEVQHMFAYFGDSAISFSYTTSWQHLTNATDSMFIYNELDGFTVSNDTITILKGGGYDFIAKFAMDGDNGETESLRFYNITQGMGVPVAGARTTQGAGNFGSLPVIGYMDDIRANDKFVLQFKSDWSGTSVFKNGMIKITKAHD